MCKSKINFILSIIVMFFLINISAFAQEEQSDKKSDSLKSNHKMMMHSKMNHNMMGMDSTKSKMMKDSTLNQSEMEGHNHSDMEMDEDKENEVSSEMKAWNTVCPVTGEEVDPSVETVEYNGKDYGFCCSRCVSKFNKDPKKYSASLSEDGKEFIEEK
ncbi:MAG: hypothetical protein STSR0008_21460 [Ignavibacterium sp.]